MGEPDILVKLVDLYGQATTERSRFYVASCVKEAMAEIARLRILLAQQPGGA